MNKPPIFIWVIRHQAWSVPTPTPQIIHDVEMFDSFNLALHNKGVYEVLFRRPLDPSEVRLSLSELEAKYPLPEGAKSAQ